MRVSQSTRSCTPRAASSNCQRQAIGGTVIRVSTAESAIHHGLAARRMSHVLPRSILVQDVGDRAARDEERRRDAQPVLHPASRACTRRSAATASRTSSSECAGESGSDSTSAPARSVTGSAG